jgi:hypothetical protein
MSNRVSHFPTLLTSPQTHSFYSNSPRWIAMRIFLVASIVEITVYSPSLSLLGFSETQRLSFLCTYH